MAKLASSSLSDGWDLVKLTGPLDFDTVTEIRPVLVPKVTEGGSNLIFDMAEVDFVDSSGVGFLVLLLKAARERDRRFILANLLPQAVDLLEITHLDGVFEITDDIDSFLSGTEPR